jgi:hypothetical protein
MSNFTRCQDHTSPHGGAQFRAPGYFPCHCDAGVCETHANAQRTAALFPRRGSDERPHMPFYEPGEPAFCELHKHEAGARDFAYQASLDINGHPIEAAAATKNDGGTR